MRPAVALLAVAAVAALACAALGCAPLPAALPRVPDLVLEDGRGAAHRLADVARGASFTVVTFFGAGCPCQRVHDERLVEMASRYRDRGVAFVAVDSEATATPGGDAAEAERRHYPFPLLTDAKGLAADALGASYATFTVILDASWRVRYRGAVDSDRIYLHDDADLYVRAALDRLVAGREPAPSSTEALGCVLRR